MLYIISLCFSLLCSRESRVRHPFSSANLGDRKLRAWDGIAATRQLS